MLANRIIEWIETVNGNIQELVYCHPMQWKVSVPYNSPLLVLVSR